MEGGPTLDKSGANKKITIKINGKNRNIQEQNQPAKKEIKKEKLEDIEQIAVQQISATQEAKDEDDFDWILPELEEAEELKEYKIASKPKAVKGKTKKGIINTNKVRQTKGILPSILLTVFFAVLLGTSLGVLMLKMVISDGAIEAGNTPMEEVPPEENNTTPTGTASLDLPAITGYVVQGGAFSNLESGETEALAMTQKGIPAKAMEMDDKVFLFVGISDNLPNAKALGVKLQENGIQTYAKEVGFGGVSKSELQESEKKFLELSPGLYETILKVTSTATLSNTIPEELLDSLNNQGKQLNEIKDLENKEIQLLKTELDGAISKIKSYSEKQDAKLLVETQQHLLNFLALYHKL